MPIVLIVIGIILIIHNYKYIKKDENSFEIRDKERESFKNVLNTSKDDLNDYKIELGILRRNIGESLTELQQEILEIKNKLNMVKNGDILYDNKESISDEDELIVNLLKDDDVISDIKFMKKNQSADSYKTEQIRMLLTQGLSDDEICHELSVSKGEVLLVRDLFKK